jgi:hypothetical protein
VVKSEPELAVGTSATFNLLGEEREFEVVGIVTAGLMGPVAFAPVSYLDSVTGGFGSVTRLQIRTPTGDPDEQARRARGRTAARGALGAGRVHADRRAISAIR